MCGRYARFTPVEIYGGLFEARGRLALDPSYNVAPTNEALAARNSSSGERELTTLRWGLIPPWAKQPRTGYSMINARAETVATKPSFRRAFRERRCLIAADGFYEWKRMNGRKQPHFIKLKEGEPFAFAGLWEHWQDEENAIDSCAIIVTEANTLVSTVHDRMPVILRPEDYDLWMDSEVKEPERLQELLRPYKASQMEVHPVGLAVNNPGNNDVRLVERT